MIVKQVLQAVYEAGLATIVVVFLLYLWSHEIPSAAMSLSALAIFLFVEIVDATLLRPSASWLSNSLVARKPRLAVSGVGEEKKLVSSGLERILDQSLENVPERLGERWEDLVKQMRTPQFLEELTARTGFPQDTARKAIEGMTSLIANTLRGDAYAYEADGFISSSKVETGGAPELEQLGTEKKEQTVPVRRSPGIPCTETEEEEEEKNLVTEARAIHLREECIHDRSVTIRKLESSYRGEWVALQVTDRDKNKFPSRGILIGHAKDRAALQETIKSMPEVYIRFVGAVIRQEREEMESKVVP